MVHNGQYIAASLPFAYFQSVSGTALLCYQLMNLSAVCRKNCLDERGSWCLEHQSIGRLSAAAYTVCFLSLLHQ